MILVAGATGLLGREICQHLVAQGERVRGLVGATSDPAEVAHLQSLGVEAMSGELQNAVSLAPACHGAWAVISPEPVSHPWQTRGTTDDAGLEGQLNLVAAAAAAGAGSFVSVSWLTGNDWCDPALAATGRAAFEQRLRESGMTYTVLLTSPCMEVWLSPTYGFDYTNARATVCGAGQDEVSWIALGDVAQFAVASLDNPSAGNATFELGGPAAVGLLEVVRIFERAAGRPFAVQYVADEALWTKQAGATVLPDQACGSPVSGYPPAGKADMRRTLDVFPIQLTSIRDYAARVLKGEQMHELNR